MIICNFKLNKKAIFKTVLGIMTIICISIGIAGIYNVLNSMEQKDNNFVKEVHDDIDTYVGQKISFSGYVYRVNGFSDDQFVLARDMDIGNKQTLIVGFLCSSEKAKDYKTYSWVNITGEITKGSYNNSYIPILKITAIEETNKPENANVTLPDDEYVPTAVIY